jgi:hypothetical protein
MLVTSDPEAGKRKKRRREEEEEEEEEAESDNIKRNIYGGQTWVQLQMS